MVGRSARSQSCIRETFPALGLQVRLHHSPAQGKNLAGDTDFDVSIEVAAGTLGRLRPASAKEEVELPSWEALAKSQRTPDREPDDFEAGRERHGWQHEAASPKRQYIGNLMPASSRQRAGLFRDPRICHWLGALSTAPSRCLNRIDSHLFWVRLHVCASLFLSHCPSVSLWPSSRYVWPPSNCMCESGWRGLATEGAMPIPATAEKLQSGDLEAPNPRDQRRAEILADGLLQCGGVHMAVDTTLASPLNSDGSPHPHWASVRGV